MVAFGRVHGCNCWMHYRQWKVYETDHESRDGMHSNTSRKWNRFYIQRPPHVDVPTFEVHLEATHPIRKVEPDAPATSRKPRKADEAEAADALVLRTSTRNVARINVSAYDHCTITIDARRIHTQRVQSVAWKRTTFVARWRLATARKSWGRFPSKLPFQDRNWLSDLLSGGHFT